MLCGRAINIPFKSYFKNDEIIILEIILTELRNPCIKSTELISQARE